MRRLMPAYRTTTICHVRGQTPVFRNPRLAMGIITGGIKLGTQRLIVCLKLPKAANVDARLKLLFHSPNHCHGLTSDRAGLWASAGKPQAEDSDQRRVSWLGGRMIDASRFRYVYTIKYAKHAPLPRVAGMGRRTLMQCWNGLC